MQYDQIYSGNAVDILKVLSTASVDCLVTSPPYFNLRNYGSDEQIGQESSVQDYIDNLVDVFDEFHRVLKKTGTVFVNLGDTYGTKSGGSAQSLRQGKVSRYTSKINHHMGKVNRQDTKPKGMHKSLLGIPQRFMIAMIDSGWICRNVIIWHKPSVVPSSAMDRFTNDFEHVFFFVKSKKYYFKTQYEPCKEVSIRRYKYGVRATNKYNTSEYGQSLNKYRPTDLNRVGKFAETGRIKRTTWSIATGSGFKGMHFATFPPALIAPMIDAGCPVGGTVLDPFCGSGTTCVVAKKQHKHYIGIDVSGEYVKIARSRVEGIL